MKTKYLLIFIFISIFFIGNSCDYLKNKLNNFAENTFTDTNYVVQIPQKIGGVLICDVDYSNDIHSWDYIIGYTYRNISNDSTYLGYGKYHGEEWSKMEQIFFINDFAYLKTSEDRDADKILFGKIGSSDPWKEYVFSPDSIENEEIWRKKKIISSPDYFDSIVKIIRISQNGEIIIEYQYAIKNRKFSFMTGSKNILYELDKSTGIPIMKKILN